MNVKQCIITLKDGYKIRATISLPNKLLSMEELENRFVAEFNKSQPNLVNKVIKIHILK